jgi:bacillithiol biosynthesis cysteine-adding enzyme BshC
MKSACIDFPEIPQTTRLFATFLEKFDHLAGYFAHPPTAQGIAAAAREVRLDTNSRRTVVAVLREENRRFAPGGELDAAAQRNLNRLAAGAVAIVTGQQAGLFSGPALTIYKALSAIRCAHELTKQGIDAVPMFWIATQDHDLAEVSESFWNTRSGLAHCQLPADARYTGHSIGRVPLGDAVTRVASAAAQTLEGPSAANIAQALRECYAPAETFGSAFGKLLARLFAGRGLLLIDPQDPQFEALAAPIYRAALEASDILTTALLDRARDLEAAGYHAQVKVTPESTLLFYTVAGRREPLRRRDSDHFSAGDSSFSKSDLLAAIEKTPEAFTGSALLRPVIQDSLLPTAAYLGGPAEIAYMAQAQVVYKAILGRMPAILPRASFTLVEPPVARFLERYELDIRDVFSGRQELRAKMEQQTLPDELAKKFEVDEAALRAMLASYRAPIEQLDKTLLGTVAAVEEKILMVFAKLKEKIGRAENFRTGVLDRHETILLNALYPNHELQERALSALPFLAAHGPQLIDDILRIMPAPGSSDSSACARRHHVLFLD